jgi:hypothetical protein
MFTTSDPAAAAVGLALKYRLAWQAVCNAVLSESAFVSLPHVLESEEELACSIDLAKNCYYKQAAQVLRAFLEGQVVDLVLACDAAAFIQWKQGTYRVPPLRGRAGILQQLQKAGVLGDALCRRVDTAYENFNSYIHGAERTLINAGLFAGQHTGRVFRPDKLHLWASQLGETVQIGILVMSIKADIWLNELRNKLKICQICNEERLEEIGSFSFGGNAFFTCRCRTCSNEQSFSRASHQRVFVVSEHEA